MPTTGSIFQGVTTAPCRDYLATLIEKSGCEKVYMPCAGRFGSAQAYVRHCGGADKLYTSDICLFSSMLGYLFDKEKNVADLGVTNGSVIQPRNETDSEVIAAAMLAIKYGQISNATLHGMGMRREILSNRDKYLDDIIAMQNALVAAMAGAHYDIQDMWDVIAEARDESKAMLFLNVPTYSGGYEKMFKNSGITWNEPSIPQFDIKRYQELLGSLTEAACFAVVYSQKNLDMVPEGWHTVYAQAYDQSRTDYLVANRPVAKSYAATNTIALPPRLLEIYADEEITENTRIDFIQVDEATALYYRDLFVHKLGTTTAESFYLMLIDGKVNTAMGLSLRDVFTQKSLYVGEVFGISRSSWRYKRLGKLFMMCLTSGEFKNQLMAKYNFGVVEPKGIKTSSLTTHWEGKTDRSVMKLTHREKLKSGQFRVIYQGDFRDDTYADCLREWLKRWGDVKRGGV